MSIEAGGNSALEEQPEVGTRSGVHQCPKCSRQFTCKSNFNRHWKVYSGQRPYSCLVCGRKFNQESNCQRHQQLHMHPRRSKKGRSGRKKSGHSRTKMSLGQDDKARETSEDGSQLLVVNQTEGELGDDRNLREAFREAESLCKLSLEELNMGREETKGGGRVAEEGNEKPQMPAVDVSAGVKSEVEVSYEVELPHRGEMEASLKEHEPQGLTIICPLCGLIGGTLSSLDQHIKAQHPNEAIADQNRKAIGVSGSDIQCLQCGRSFSLKSNLKKHMLIHSGVRPYSCPDCGRTFNQSGNVLRHQRTCHQVHSALSNKGEAAKTSQRKKRSRRASGKESTDPEEQGNTPAAQPAVHVQFLCYVCGHGFLSQDSLEVHEQSHRRELPYRCAHCGRGFAHVQNFSRHLLVHTGERPWHCRDCGLRFNQASNLNRHCRTKGHQGATTEHTGVWHKSKRMGRRGRIHKLNTNVM
ncbi:zinc finger protein 16-like [Anguilla anguilla]|uniref:C2H2-type domain-containing protein n=1 Tax=Anguilla anguilla TaxID=7936 RepID=A0A9D3MW67_ANGAN|nr:zinc finger protein 16-like [Anguilla anguilla]XP_035239613.1 zinc finger protein 16-like [Anguilla anguilla]KAG5856186.1 hypothetical protein ANANG_G00005360 [Anguilla anguilla]